MEAKFDTLKREGFARAPPSESEYPALHSLILPHIASFNSIFDDNLIDMAIANLEPRELIDSAGNRLKCIYFTYAQFGWKKFRLESLCSVKRSIDL